MTPISTTRARERIGLSMRGLAILAGIDVATISRIESGLTASPGIDTVRALERALELRRDEELVFGRAKRRLARAS